LGVHHHSKGGQALLSVVLGILCSVFQDPAAAAAAGDLVYAHENNKSKVVYTMAKQKDHPSCSSNFQHMHHRLTAGKDTELLLNFLRSLLHKTSSTLDLIAQHSARFSLKARTWNIRLMLH
jgi:hypothetical protein